MTGYIHASFGDYSDWKHILRPAAPYRADDMTIYGRQCHPDHHLYPTLSVHDVVIYVKLLHFLQ